MRCESWLNNQNLSIPGFHTLRKDRAHARGGGIVVWIRKSLDFETITISLPRNVAEIFRLRLKNCRPKLDVMICFRPPSLKTTLQNWENIIQCVDVSRAALFMGDFNAHNKSWNCALCDNNGLNFEQAYAARGLSL
uniref:Endonuclease/exonuclease/phosphatase domain-containing protein n=1 Tax=Trichogramma kaykai TaxID=54128 RepID=A0ABD2WPA8_9HYME